MTHPSGGSPPTTASAGTREPTRGGFWLRVAVWGVLASGMIAFMFLGSVAMVSYTFNGFLGRTFRDVGEKSIIGIWRYQVSHLPSFSAQSVVDSVFVASLLIMVVGVLSGAWLLIVRGPEETDAPAAGRLRRFNSR